MLVMEHNFPSFLLSKLSFSIFLKRPPGALGVDSLGKLQGGSGSGSTIQRQLLELEKVKAKKAPTDIF
jgi:hypothetical protein